MIKTLIVDDSLTVRELLKALLESDPEFRVIGLAESGEQALEFLQKEKPDIITMDLHMPGLSGIEVTEKIMSSAPVPIVIVTADREQALHSFRLLEAGAVAVLETPPAPGQEGYRKAAETLIKTLRSLSGMRLVRRISKTNNSRVGTAEREETKVCSSSIWSGRVILIGASTGGPQTIKQLVADLPENFPLPIVVVQHIAQGFLPGLVRWLNESKSVKAKLAENGELLQSGFLYLAPDDQQCGINSRGEIVLTDAAKENGLRPAVSYLFRSGLKYRGKLSAILLTGMGTDGALELGLLKNAGVDTIAQDKESSIVFGMPAEAIKLGNARQVLSVTAISAYLKVLAKMDNNADGMKAFKSTG
ncbi:MAG: chemotaxis-specific protein-glutamate methyltransferase CheB [Candidatus Obscuribacterales bacterium]|nr:chemotaxis-specific protein-glutamate methyltransferase CheB [Candidatus Obscuribacterales bacterium]